MEGRVFIRLSMVHRFPEASLGEAENDVLFHFGLEGPTWYDNIRQSAEEVREY